MFCSFVRSTCKWCWRHHTQTQYTHRSNWSIPLSPFNHSQMQNQTKQSKQTKNMNEFNPNQHLPSKSFSQFFNPRIASIVCLGVIDPNLRDVSPRQISSENESKKRKTYWEMVAKQNTFFYCCVFELKNICIAHTN